MAADGSSRRRLAPLTDRIRNAAPEGGTPTSLRGDVGHNQGCPTRSRHLRLGYQFSASGFRDLRNDKSFCQ